MFVIVGVNGYAKQPVVCLFLPIFDLFGRDHADEPHFAQASDVRRRIHEYENVRQIFRARATSIAFQ